MAPISFVKCDRNRGIHETASACFFDSYLRGLYRVLEQLTTRFPDVLWEGCASGGGRFVAGMLPYFAQSRASNKTDPVDRTATQLSATIACPTSSELDSRGEDIPAVDIQ
ncbi:Glycoside family 36 [Cordyceps militaris]|uniref:alpha-galactosidase n=1 Tax=Cordyceps militaris TaxID=73501 RepID=A0A2H4S5T0_CORMI|nr:Glycoside family 36 [Cordyceps militaris]